jgi:hypothetical protein
MIDTPQDGDNIFERENTMKELEKRVNRPTATPKKGLECQYRELCLAQCKD